MILDSSGLWEDSGSRICRSGSWSGVGGLPRICLIFEEDYEDDSGIWDDSGSRSSTRGFADLAVGAGVDEWVTTNQGFARR